MIASGVIQPEWGAPARVKSLMSTRQGGVSLSPFDSFNLAGHVGDDPSAVRRNRAVLQTLSGVPAVWLEQVHGSAVVVVDRDALDRTAPPVADAAVAFMPGIACAVLTADCLPVLLCDRDASVVAAAHAGWRGLCEGVLERTVAAMRVAPDGVMAWLGPAIGPAAFEVGSDVRDAFIRRTPAAEAAFLAREGCPGKWLADLYGLARLRLQAQGISMISGGGCCTYSDPVRFFSYRRDGRCGRMAAMVWLAD